MARKGYKCVTYTWDGVRHYCYAETKEEAQKKADIEIALLEAGVKASPTNKITVKAWSAEWLQTYKYGLVSDPWYKAIESVVDNIIVPEIGDKLVRKVSAADIQRLMNKQSQLSESHQRKVAQTITQIFDSAEENRIIDRIPLKRIKIAQTSQKQGHRTISATERSLTLSTADKYPDSGLFFLIMLYCGCRPQEVSRLMVGDYDTEKKILHIRRARKADGVTGIPKSAAGYRDIPVPDYLAERLYSIPKNKKAYIVTSTLGEPLTRSSERCMWERFRRHMDIENGAKLFRNAIVESTIADDLCPYCYRHTYCTDLQDAGVPLSVARVLMGHSDIKMTAEIYTHRSDESFEDAREKINKHSK